MHCAPIDRRSDIFAIGIVLYELTTLNKLFRGDNDLEVMKQLIEGEVTPPSQHARRLSARARADHAQGAEQGSRTIATRPRRRCSSTSRPSRATRSWRCRR